MERRRTPRPQCVLLADDSADLREMWTLWLTFWGFRVEEAGDGAEAVEKARRQHPDLILMDLAMPIVDGYTAIKMLEADPSTAEIPVLGLSAQVLPHLQYARGHAAPMFFPKPADPERLLTMIRATLREAADSAPEN